MSLLGHILYGTTSAVNSQAAPSAVQSAIGKRSLSGFAFEPAAASSLTLGGASRVLAGGTEQRFGAALANRGRANGANPLDQRLALKEFT